MTEEFLLANMTELVPIDQHDRGVSIDQHDRGASIDQHDRVSFY